jgi:hypothetical protein
MSFEHVHALNKKKPYCIKRVNEFGTPRQKNHLATFCIGESKISISYNNISTGSSSFNSDWSVAVHVLPKLKHRRHTA